MSIILRAARLAEQAHRGQYRKWITPPQPYFVHPCRVAGRVAALPDADETMVAVAFLHDVLEDTTVTAEAIFDACGGEVLRIVRDLTNPSKGSRAPRAERKRQDRLHLASCQPAVQTIKLIDRQDNLADISFAEPSFQGLYARESLDLVDAIGSACPEVAEVIRGVCRYILGE